MHNTFTNFQQHNM